MRDEKSVSSMDPAEERMLWDLVGVGDDESRERIIMAYRPMVFWLAQKFRAPYNSYPDLVQEGMVGLISAVDNFDVSRSNRFITYAYYKVRGRMVNFLQRSEAKAPRPVEDEFLERADSFEADIDKIEWQLAIKEGFEHLPRKEKEVISSLVIEGRRAAEVAVEQGVGVSHVYRLQRKAISRLRCWFARGDATSEA
ncbi:MAG: sigma-70 family RNA polymerase sigma factor [Synergistaceae bacterium]|nr:sigma-70 family RNA polymerase sigma factor [Synergistaceae bacterium]